MLTDLDAAFYFAADRRDRAGRFMPENPGDLISFRGEQAEPLLQAFRVGAAQTGLRDFHLYLVRPHHRIGNLFHGDDARLTGHCCFHVLLLFLIQACLPQPDGVSPKGWSVPKDFAAAPYT